MWLKIKASGHRSVGENASLRLWFNVSFMAKNISIVLVFFSVCSHGQPLRDINYEYLYNPDASVSFQLKAVRGAEDYTILYSLRVRDTVGLMNQFNIAWEGRSMLGDKEGDAIALREGERTRTLSGFSGRGTISGATAPRYILAKVIHKTSNRAWLFYSALEPNNPVAAFLTRNGSVVTEAYLRTNESATLPDDSGRWIVSYYDDDFPAAAPAFSEAQARVSRIMESDSIYNLMANEEVNFSKKGLYLLQKDTTSIEGLAFRVEEDYPQYTRLTNLPGPLIYISTRQEYERLIASTGNKKAFDRVILSIASDTDRARILMRNYFRRVELANRFFTSYKEGWKTDRGMIYIIFGKPDTVFRFDDREVWTYDNDQFDIRFNFSRSSTLFDPDNFVLIREKKYESTWYEAIDLWRNARF